MAMAHSPYSSSDRTSIRASVYDVFLELGALDSNSRVADWFFTDPTHALPDPDVNEVDSHSPPETVRFVDEPRVQDGLGADGESPKRTSRSTSSSKSFGLKFSPKSIRSRSKTKSVSSTPSRTTSGDGYETDEGYVSASSPSGSPKKSRVRSVFSLQTLQTTRSAGSAESPSKLLPSLPPIREKLDRHESSSSVARAKSLFRKRAKSPSPDARDNLEQWHEVGTLSPRIFNPSATNGVPLAPPSAFRQLVSPARDTDDSDAEHSPPRTERLSFALPRTLFHSISITKRRITAKTRPRSLNLGDSPTRFASSLPSSPFILVTEGEPGGGASASAGPHTPFVFVTPIDNPTPLNSARRFSDVTSMTAPLYPLSISRTLRRSMVFDKLEPAFPRLRPSSSYSSLQDALATSAASPYELYNQAIPAIRRGKEAPFPARPVLPQPLSATMAGESRLATIQRYREFSEQLVELTPYKRFAAMREGDEASNK
ncbi:hypothetical protein DFH07DRAFT_244522 [Mycena maculata]|uniref:Uncharacterized protein n=1 Tax=Mycena maculata TaxID=230809 RepID=A0AAD7MP14_9AGAR|nr:hypothetical protein DFH07DRAFT_244522 [Mycena maculata]